MAGILEKENSILRIKLSNTESAHSNIFKYSNLKKESESRASSTAGYFLNTNANTIRKMQEFIGNDEFIVDVLKTKEYIEKMDEVVNLFTLSDFHGNLQDYFIERGTYFVTTNNFSIGYPDCSVDTNGRLNLKFENMDDNVKKFRGVIIAILCNIIIEKNDNKNIIYPVLKDNIIEKVKNEYLFNDIEGDTLKMKEKFREWLYKKGNQESSIDSYCSQLDLMSRESIEDGIIQKSLYEIINFEELENIVPLIINSIKFKNRQENSNNINSAALNHYRNFLKNYYDEELFLEDVYISKEKYKTLTSNLLHKKNIILQGAPGVGKTFMAKRLAYSIIGEKDANKVKLIQFHQSYAYEDFIEGYRPNDNGGFDLRPGKFIEFCEKAREGLKNNEKYFLIIDEINRGNLSKIFGELLMLVEKDKREESLDLAYSNKPFSVPENVYIIGMMNTADRSLAIMDFALRRRFSFITINPAFNNQKFIDEFNSIYGNELSYVIDLIKDINETDIKTDQSLKSGFMIGHSYFCQKYEGRKGNLDDIKNIFNFEIIPLLQEYWEYDDPKKYAQVLEKIKNKGIISQEQYDELTV